MNGRVILSIGRCVARCVAHEAVVFSAAFGSSLLTVWAFGGLRYVSVGPNGWFRLAAFVALAVVLIDVGLRLTEIRLVKAKRP